MYKKIALLLLSYENLELYRILENKIKSTWASIKNPNCDIWYYYGDSNEFSVKDNVIRCPYPEGYANIGLKTICAFEYLLNTDFDYLFRPNSSSFVNINRLVEFVQELPKEKFYGGKPIWFYGGGITEKDEINPPQNCAHGCGYILSRDLVELIVNKKNEWGHHMIDDMALCRFMKNYDINITPVPFLDIHDIKEDGLYSNGNLINDDDLLKYHHIRTESENMNRSKNIEILDLCFKKIVKYGFGNNISNAT